MLVCEKIVYQVTTLIIFGRLSLVNLSKVFWKSKTISQISIVHIAGNSFKDDGFIMKAFTLHVDSSLTEHINRCLYQLCSFL